jgi:hypothetical protein
MGGAMGGADTTQNTQSQSVQQLPPWINQAAQQNYGFAQNVAMQPLQQYQGQMVADVSPQMQQSWNTAATGGNAGQDQYNAAQAGYLTAAGTPATQVTPQSLAGTNLNPYLSPYVQDVINKTLPLMQQQNALQQNQLANQANSANAFGGSRQGIQQGVAQAQGAMNIGQMAAQLNQANFGQAQAAATGDITRGLQGQMANQAADQANINSLIAASGGLANLGNQAQLSQARNFTEQMTAGQMEQQQAQNQINAQMAKFQQAANYPNQQLSILQSALGMTPYEQGTQGASTTQTQTAANPMGMALGGLQTLGSLFSAPAGGTSAAAGALGIFSDRRMKTDITKVGTHPSGIAIHAYRYKGDPKSYPKVVGPMAEDVAKRFGPAAVAKIPGSGGKMAVHPAVMGALAGPAMGPPVSAMSMGGPRMPGPNLATIAGARPPMGAMASPIPAAAMGGPRMPGPNLAAIATGGMGPLAGPKPMRARRLRMPQLRGALAGG